jgi:hypothetical protein
MTRESLRHAVAQVALALREPEAFALGWERQGARSQLLVWSALGLTAALGTTVYGIAMGIGGGPAAMLACGVDCTLAAGLAWGIPLPTLYIFNSITGSRLSLASTLLAALITTSWGGLAMIASVPISWFFAVSLPLPYVLLAVNLAICAAVGVAMIDVFGRVMSSLEPSRGRRSFWILALVGAIGAELFYAFDLFDFGARLQ